MAATNWGGQVDDKLLLVTLDAATLVGLVQTLTPESHSLSRTRSARARYLES